ncbi:MAG: sugar nucleotide-binding protein [Cyanobacteriota bacterium]|nr:sugar nucleotide-binding protein [Cyanobacteriota bacterium]
MNGGAPRAFAEALADTGGRLLQVSTDFVFNGQQGSPYRPEQARDPLGAYGRTKAAGEEAVEQVLGGSGRGVILRTRCSACSASAAPVARPSLSGVGPRAPSPPGSPCRPPRSWGRRSSGWRDH